MKKVMLLVAAASIAAATNAKILRVNNTPGSSAPYTTIAAAHTDAIAGDTIMVDGSATSYGTTITLSKRVVLLGPGYAHVENGVVNEGMQPAVITNIEISKENVIVQGMTVTSVVTIYNANATVSRCHVGIIQIAKDASNSVIHQNYIVNRVKSLNSSIPSNISVTNNIFATAEPAEYTYDVGGLNDSYIANNTWIRELGNAKHNLFGDLSACTIENNILNKAYETTGNLVFNNNYVFGETPYTDDSSERALRTTEESISDGTFGAFSGDDPYVLSGIPAGPVIEDMTIPTTVDEGDNLNVVIKLGLQK